MEQTTGAGATAVEIGDEYLQGIDRESRREQGQVYTPAHVVRFVVDQLDLDAILDRPLRILDPACGAGAFLEEIVRRLASRLRERGTDLHELDGAAELHRLVQRSVFGIDRDPLACGLARQTLRAAVQRATGGRAMAPGELDANVTCADFLLHTADVPLLRRAERYDVIVGNPPYVSTSRLQGATKDRLRRAYQSASGRLDLYALFIEQSLSLLEPRGQLSFIVPDKFLISRSGEALRTFILEHGRVTRIARFRSHRVFEDAATVPCVIRIDRVAAAGPTEVLDCVDGGDAVSITRRELVPTTLGGGPWYLSAPEEDELAARICGQHRRLGTLMSRISAGPATGRDAVYVRPAAEWTGVEPELLHPVVRGRDLVAGAIHASGLEILVPYRFDRGAPQLIRLEDFPGAAAYLEGHRAVLEDRHCVRTWEKAWFDLHDQILVHLARLPKLLVPDVANGNRFALDPGRLFPLHSVYYLLPDPQLRDLEAVVAILNSSPCEFLVRLRAPLVKDGFSRYRKQFIEGLPIPELRRADVRAVVAASRAGDRDRVDELLAPCFGLGERELAHVRASVERYRANGEG